MGKILLDYEYNKIKKKYFGDHPFATDAVLYLEADMATIIRNISSRDRKEEQAIDNSYLESLVEAYDGYLKQIEASQIPYCRVNVSDKNYIEQVNTFLNKILTSTNNNTL